MKIRKSLAVLAASASLALGFGGVMAPSAQAHTPDWGDASYTQTDLRTGTWRTGTAVESPGGSLMDPPASARSLRCWNADISGRAFAISCSGSRWRAFADCTDDSRYITPALRGAKRVTIYCPAGTRAVRGGAFGR
ncbi:hypothetical protein DB35_15300 [Streptomyces abyssalis]|uniref:Secreted protein n=1 Tax=Streptomyces abyssalis TaxID=933944 RepID=A0A1E7JFY3_9ACTN|nr:hypothetical protein [Streptomyces abyssalis]OEU85375.1 hypothetical protein AN215_22710 [Streptomyces abyssalis]OEU93162.1 hypothetical protein DB35_15300 [Streptomyces abyssalis]OEV32193.1 hypothetical protein AN219_00340 [Streptomyces nanshensis]